MRSSILFILVLIFIFGGGVGSSVEIMFERFLTEKMLSFGREFIFLKITGEGLNGDLNVVDNYFLIFFSN